MNYTQTFYPIVRMILKHVVATWKLIVCRKTVMNSDIALPKRQICKPVAIAIQFITLKKITKIYYMYEIYTTFYLNSFCTNKVY